jgi:hypothetical protein
MFAAMTVFGEIKYAFVARSMAARGAGLFGPAATTAAASCGYNSWGLRTANPRRSQSLFAS